jgi:nicotinate-nucleotide pyrophosphorylase (carboxylating)
MNLLSQGLRPLIRHWLEEDDLTRNIHYTRTLPDRPVIMTLKIKSDLVFAGADFFIATFEELGVPAADLEMLNDYEARSLKAGTIIEFPSAIPFSIAVTGERLALNLLQHGSSIATWTKRYVDLTNGTEIKVLDTRKTTPGLRSLEKYAVRVGGGFNHRLGQSDVWMIKDNHKSCLGGLGGALEFFRSQGAFYNSIIAEIHDLKELKEAIDLGLKHIMLDNFSLADIAEAVKLKAPGMTYEVSGGVRLETLKNYFVSGVDAISIGALTYDAPRVDLSLKYRPA